ncbi:hypothetical protein CBL_05698 [Carabus blaptoides fortunei]
MKRILIAVCVALSAVSWSTTPWMEFTKPPRSYRRTLTITRSDTRDYLFPLFGSTTN